MFNNHSLPKRCGEGLSRPRSVSRLSFSPEPSQLLHYCPGYSQAQLIRLIVSIYDGVPEAFEVFHCRPSSTEEELGLFLKRAAKHPLQYLVLEVNRLPFKLQEVHECLTISPHDCDSPCLSLTLSPSLSLPPSPSLPLPPSLSLPQYLMQLHLVIQQRVRQEREAGMSSKAPCLHFVETAPSVLREMPWVILREHTVSVYAYL